jgi:hypothetical protein
MFHRAFLAFPILALATSTSLSGAEDDLRMLTSGQMEEDLFLLSDVLEREHAGRLRYVQPEELDEAFGQALDFISEGRSILEFYRQVSELLSLLHCGHTRARLSSQDSNAVLARRGVLPIEVCLRGERAWIIRSLDELAKLEPGAELLAVDGITIAEIRRIAFTRMGGDGFIETGKERALERGFASLFPALVAPIEVVNADYRLEIAGRAEPVEVTGLSPAVFARRSTPRPGGPIVRLETIADEKLGIVTIRGFGDPGGGEKSFPELLEERFVQLEQEGIVRLIIDLRGNGGGDDTYGALLVSYIAHEPFRYFERIEVTPDYEGYGDVIEKDGRHLVTAHPGLQVQPVAEHAFQGEAVLLIDGRTFSTAADVATVVNFNGLATLIGEETGGGYDGNTSGVSERFPLPNSGLQVNVPCWMYTTANLGHDRPGRGAPADHPMRSSIEDLLDGRDAELELARELLGKD